jgi:hypothetical protein
MSCGLCFVKGLIEIVRGDLWHHAGTRARTVLLVSRNALGVLPILSDTRARFRQTVVATGHVEVWRDLLLRPVTSERKTGVKHAEVVTARLVQDERGWLRLAG